MLTIIGAAITLTFKGMYCAALYLSCSLRLFRPSRYCENIACGIILSHSLAVCAVRTVPNTHCLKVLLTSSQIGYADTSPASAIVTCCEGLPLALPTASIAFTSSIPSTTWPNTTAQGSKDRQHAGTNDTQDPQIRICMARVHVLMREALTLWVAKHKRNHTQQQKMISKQAQMEHKSPKKGYTRPQSMSFGGTHECCGLQKAHHASHQDVG